MRWQTKLPSPFLKIPVYYILNWLATLQRKYKQHKKSMETDLGSDMRSELNKAKRLISLGFGWLRIQLFKEKQKYVGIVRCI